MRILYHVIKIKIFLLATFVTLFFSGLLVIFVQTIISGTLSNSESKSLLVAEFYKRAQKDLTMDKVGPLTEQYVHQLRPDEQMEIARTIIDNPDERFSSFAISLFVKLGHEDEAVSKLAKLVAGGSDITGFFWAWLHNGDSSLADRMLGKIKRYLLNHKDKFGEEERKRIDLLLKTE